MKKQKKVFNLADRKEVLQLMKQLYGNDEVKDDTTTTTTNSTTGATRTDMVGSMAESSPCSKRPLLQDKQ